MNNSEFLWSRCVNLVNESPDKKWWLFILGSYLTEFCEGMETTELAKEIAYVQTYCRNFAIKNNEVEGANQLYVPSCPNWPTGDET